MERVIVAEVTEYLLKNSMISQHQHGFLSRRSTATNLLECLSDWTLAIDNSQSKAIIYIDFMRAFDTISSQKLVHKLQKYGITSNLLKFISSFLSDRSQRTRVGRSVSESTRLTSGTAQGSCLGPLLFLIYINDVCKIFDKNVQPKLFADDLKLYTSIKSDVDQTILQTNLTRLAKWAEDWQLLISIRKCCVLNINKKQPATNYYIHGNPLPNVDHTTDL